MGLDDLRNHVFKTYVNQRIGISIIAVSLPIVLWLVGKYLYNIQLQESLSAYYHAGATTRDLFVGALCAIGAFLFLYKGFSRAEDIALNIAGFFVVCVAIIPMASEPDMAVATIFGLQLTLHGIVVVLFFLSIAYVCIRCASDTLYMVSDESLKRFYAIFYNILGAVMIVVPLYTFLLLSDSRTFAAETLAIWTFSAYWVAKTMELMSTRAERNVLEQEGDPRYPQTATEPEEEEEIS